MQKTTLTYKELLPIAEELCRRLPQSGMLQLWRNEIAMHRATYSMISQVQDIARKEGLIA